jgi:hypothetical protein
MFWKLDSALRVESPLKFKFLDSSTSGITFIDVWSRQNMNTTNMCLSVFFSQTLELNHVVLSQGKFFNFVPDNDARMLALCKFCPTDRQTTEVIVSTYFRAGH